MKISDLLQSLTEGTRNFESQLDEWNKGLTAKGNELMAKADEWQKSADQRTKEWATQLTAYSNGVDADLKAEWTKLQQNVDTQVQTLRDQANAWRAEAEKKDAVTAAKWYEAYAANMVALAKRTEQEAASAIAAAIDARAKADAKKA